MTTTDLSDYKTLYLQTAKEYIDSLLVGCDKLVSDSQNKEAVNQIHISSHSLKSQSQVMGFINIAAISANIEKISNDILSGVGQADNGFISFLKKSVEKMKEMLKLIQHDTLRKTL